MEAFWLALPAALANDLVGKTAFSCFRLFAIRFFKWSCIISYFLLSVFSFYAFDNAISNSFSIWFVWVKENKTDAPYLTAKSNIFSFKSSELL